MAGETLTDTNVVNEYMNAKIRESQARLNRKNAAFTPVPERASVKLQRAENDAAGKACNPFRRK